MHLFALLLVEDGAKKCVECSAQRLSGVRQTNTTTTSLDNGTAALITRKKMNALSFSLKNRFVGSHLCDLLNNFNS